MRETVLGRRIQVRASFWATVVLATVLLVLAPAIHAYIHPDEVQRTTNCPSTGYTLSFINTSGQPNLLAIFHQTWYISPSSEFSLSTRFNFRRPTTRAPPSFQPR